MHVDKAVVHHQMQHILIYFNEKCVFCFILMKYYVYCFVSIKHRVWVN